MSVTVTQAQFDELELLFTNAEQEANYYTDYTTQIEAERDKHIAKRDGLHALLDDAVVE